MGKALFCGALTDRKDELKAGLPPGFKTKGEGLSVIELFILPNRLSGGLPNKDGESRLVFFIRSLVV